MTLQKKPKYHPDVTLFLVAIPLISAINYHLTWSTDSLSWYLVLTYSIDTIQGFIAWLAVRRIIIAMDIFLPYGDRPLRRIVYQLLITTFVGLFILAFLTELTSLIALGRLAPFSFYSFDMVIIAIWFLVINGVYIGFHFYHATKTVSSASSPRSKHILVNHGKKTVSLAIEEIRRLTKDGDYVVVFNQSQKKFLVDRSLNRFEQDLPAEQFYRVNRQCIIHRDLVQSFERLDYGKLKVWIKDQNQVEAVPIVISRAKAAQFKKWMKEGTLHGTL